MRHSSKAAGWFDVDKEGLAKLVERRGKGVVLLELLQNAWDTRGARNVTAHLIKDGRGVAEVLVQDDDPDGFTDIRTAWTLFAESEKKGDAERRGRFNLGEKLVLALCEEARIGSTTGTVQFSRDGGRRVGRERTKRGSYFRGFLRMTHEEVGEAVAEGRRCLPPEGVCTTLNGEEIPHREPFYRSIIEGLQTEVAGEDGILRVARRSAMVRWYLPAPGEAPMLYEMGIPVVEVDLPFHVDIGQKIPLTFERDNVRPAYLRRIRELTLEHVHEWVTGEEATRPWVTEALPKAGGQAVRHVVKERFGDKAVIADPSDREGENIAKAEGYTVVPGGSFTRSAWEAIREAQALKPAGQVTPSRPNATVPAVPVLDPTPAMLQLAKFSLMVSRLEGIQGLRVTFIDNPTVSELASYGREAKRLTFNIGTLGRDFFEDSKRREDRVRLVIHELAHEWGHHLESGYHRALERIGARLVEKALTDPEFFDCVKGSTS